MILGNISSIKKVFFLLFIVWLFFLNSLGPLYHDLFIHKEHHCSSTFNHNHNTRDPNAFNYENCEIEAGRNHHQICLICLFYKFCFFIHKKNIIRTAYTNSIDCTHPFFTLNITTSFIHIITGPRAPPTV